MIHMKRITFIYYYSFTQITHESFKSCISSTVKLYLVYFAHPSLYLIPKVFQGASMVKVAHNLFSTVHGCCAKVFKMSSLQFCNCVSFIKIT